MIEMSSGLLSRFLLIAGTVFFLGACGGGSPEPAAETPTPEAPPTEESLDGFWLGSQSDGREFSFSVSGTEIYDVAVPEQECGAGFPSTLADRFSFDGLKFKINSVGLIYEVYEKDTPPGQGVPAQDKFIIVGRFTSPTTAEGTIETKVQTDQGTSERCQVTWTATKA